MNTEKIQEIFRDIFDEPELLINREMTAADVEEWDSLSHINLLAAIEKEFGFRFSLSEVKGLKNVGEMIDLVKMKTS